MAVGRKALSGESAPGVEFFRRDRALSGEGEGRDAENARMAVRRVRVDMGLLKNSRVTKAGADGCGTEEIARKTQGVGRIGGGNVSVSYFEWQVS